MELREFICETIVQISNGVNDAIEKCKDLDVIINPNVMTGSKDDYVIPKKTNKDIERRVQIIDMDIAVTVSDSSENNAGCKFGIEVLGFGAKMKDSSVIRSENRIKFSIPVSLPITDSKVIKCNRTGFGAI